MKRNVEFNVKQEAYKLVNLTRQLDEIDQKVLRLREHLEKLQQSVQDSYNNIQKVGETTKVDPSSVERNMKLRTEKLEILKNILREEGQLERIERYLPDIYKDL